MHRRSRFSVGLMEKFYGTQGFQTYDGAKNASPDGVVIRVGDLYLGGDIYSFLCVEIINAQRCVKGVVTLKGLESLGNANHAMPAPDSSYHGDPIFQ